MSDAEARRFTVATFIRGSVTSDRSAVSANLMTYYLIFFVSYVVTALFGFRLFKKNSEDVLAKNSYV